MFTSICMLFVDVQFLIKTYQTPQDPNIHESLDLACHSSLINQYQSAVEDGDAGKEKEENSYLIKCQENNFKLRNNQNVKLKKEFKNDIFFQVQNEMTCTYSPTYTTVHSYKKQGNGKLSNVSLYDTHCPYFSRAANKFDDTSYYTSYCIDNGNSSLKSNIDYHFTNYGKYLKPIENNFEICCTPEICDKIFESVLKSKSLRNQFVIKSDQNLTSDIPMNPCTSNNNCDTSGNERTANILHAKFNCPYRTVSHFGFNSPMREPQPDHKHITVNPENDNKYVPVRRSVSYEEIFSSPRYLNLCEYCFERVVRLKPKLMKYKTNKQHNLKEQSHLCFKIFSEENDVTVDTVSSINDDQDLSGEDLKEPYSIFSFQLDPVGEVQERTNSNDNFSHADLTNSTFNENITRMNYSELNTNSNYINTPHTMNSENSLPEFKDIDFKSSIDLKKNTSNDKVANYANNNYNTFEISCNNSSSNHSLTEMYEFNNWNGISTVMNKFLITTKQNSESFENTVKIQNLKKNSHKLMNREERSRRKLEFQELWKDGSIAENLENVKELTAYSDTKSVANETPKNVLKMKSTKQLEQNIIVEDRDLFNERSSVYSQTSELNSNQHKYKVVAAEVLKSTSSRRKLNSSERKRTENMLSSLSHASRKNNQPEYCQKSENDYQLEDLNKVSQVSKVQRSSDTAFRDSENDVGFIYNDFSETTEKFSTLERTILEKIHVNELSKSEEIFGKIENTIRNKLTPSKLELIIKEQSLLLQNENKDILAKPLNLSDSHLSAKSLRRSYSLTPLRFNTSTPKYKLNEAPRVNKKSATNSSYIKKPNLNKNTNTKCRNFILENIRNVSIPRQTPKIKRLQSNIDPKIVKKHCFTSSSMLQSGNKLSKDLLRSPTRQQYVSSRNSGSSAIYSFQSKIVKGSPRFWISMSQISTNNSQLPSPLSTKMAATPSLKHVKSINSKLAIAAIGNKFVNNVDAEINALGDEIQQIQPRLEKYKRKLNDFGNRVAECVNNINECVTTQKNIISVQQKLRDCTELHQYTEEIMCRAQTFSLSETED